MIDYIIMAQGKQKRWKDLDRGDDFPDIPKQALPVGEISNVQRTINMFSGYGNVHIVCDETLEPYFDKDTVAKTLTIHGDCGTLLFGINVILSQKFIQSQKIVFLLGDVVFSYQMRNKIVSFRDDFPTIFGRRGKNEITGKHAPELFALACENGWYSLLSSATHDIYERKNRARHDAKLWDLERDFNFPIVTVPHDYTDDIDSVQEYREFYPKLKLEAEKDDKRNSIKK